MAHVELQLKTGRKSDCSGATKSSTINIMFVFTTKGFRPKQYFVHTLYNTNVKLTPHRDKNN